MKIDIQNKVIRDLLRVVTKNVKGDYMCTDKTDKIIHKSNLTILPLIIEKNNIYEGYEKKIAHYYKNIDKYNSLGIDNVEQYLSLVVMKLGKANDKQRYYALMIQEYLTHKSDYIKMGFLSLNDYIQYRKIFDKSKNYEDAALEYSLNKEYEVCKEEFKDKGIYSVNDLKIYNKMIKEALFVYEKARLERYVSLEEFLNFELREFSWKKEYYNNNNESLIGVRAYISKRYSVSKETLNIDKYPYFLEPDYHYKKNSLINFTAYFNRCAILMKIRNKYKSEKVKDNYFDYLKESMED